MLITCRDVSSIAYERLRKEEEAEKGNETDEICGARLGGSWKLRRVLGQMLRSRYTYLSLLSQGLVLC